ncbi:g6345 [Coccomyxa viridis]|uniref:G6345 protein n=1 Tax=Coccomyxa viridis TaxID=1274662 RepID=A0ABP1FV55_9CHLO
MSPSDHEGLLKGKNVLLTGASRGIGRAIAEAYAKNGARLFIVARTTEKLEEVKESCEKLGSPEVTILEADMLQEDDLAKISEAVKGEVDVLVNNAGMATSGSILEGSPDEAAKLVTMNLIAPMQLTILLAPQLHGHIINISSVAGLHAIKSQSIYCASKWGLTGFSLTCFEDLKEKNVGVTAIFPAYTESSMTDSASFPSDKMIRPEDIAEAALLPFRMSKFACPSEIVVRNAIRP